MILADYPDIKAMGHEVAHQIAAQVPAPLLVGVMDGGLRWLALLLDRWPGEVPPDYATVNTRSYTGMIRGDYPPGFLKAARDRQVVLVDDICDSGETLYHLKTTLTPLAAHVWTCAMLDKSAARQVPVFLDFCGMALDGTPFVYGFGLDIDGAHRGLNQIGIKQ